MALRQLGGVVIVMACQRAQAPEPPPPAPAPPPAPVPAVAPRPPPVDAAVVAVADAAALLPGVGDPSYPTPNCPPSTLAALEQCIIDQGLAWHVDEAGSNAAGDLHLLYVHEDVYIAAALGGSWRVVDMLKHVQDHGHRHSDLTVKAIRDTRSAGVRVTRIDYHFTSDTEIDNDRDEHGLPKDEHDDRDETATCTWKPNAVACDTHPW